jgi:D-alanyl-D-alanine carboxypeptidase/D-alanyl-D-alanine-endopeptidase (penicillin-binding protein 4)
VHFLRLRAAVLAAAVASALAPHAGAQPTFGGGLRNDIDSELFGREIDGARWGALVVDLETGRTLYEHDSGELFSPASNTKLVTTAAALHLLGPDFRWETSLWVEGTIIDGTLWGNLIVRGSGDPTLGARFDGFDRRRVFRAWADSLKAMGITRVAGDLVGDDDVFSDEPYGVGWEPEDFIWGYGAQIAGLTFHEGTVHMRVQPTRTGQRADLSWDPSDTDYVTVTNASLTRPAGGDILERYERPDGTNRITVSSEVPLDTIEEEALAVHNPTAYFLHVLLRTLGENGVEVRGAAVDVDDWDRQPDYGMLRLAATHLSIPLRDVIDVTNTESHNLFAEHILRTLGALRYGGFEFRPGSAASGVAAMWSFFEDADIQPHEVRLVDGSGLSPMNRITPRAIIRLLRFMNEHPDRAVRDAFYRSLALGGRTGTLERRFRNGPGLDNVRAKTGFINSVRTLSGYVTSRSGRRLAFSFLCNGFNGGTSRVTAAQDAAVEVLARYSGR